MLRGGGEKKNRKDKKKLSEKQLLKRPTVSHETPQYDISLALLVLRPAWPNDILWGTAYFSARLCPCCTSEIGKSPDNLHAIRCKEGRAVASFLLLFLPLCLLCGAIAFRSRG